MGAHMQGGAQPLPIALIGQAVPKLTRHELEALTERLLVALDQLEGDPDLEPNGDELDGDAAEDDFMDHSYRFRTEPGCPIADPDCAVDDQPCDEDFDQEHDYRQATRVIHGDDQRRVMVRTPIGLMERYRHS